MEKYNHKEIEAKWAREWIDRGTFVPNLLESKKPYYALFMFPYPSAEGLHIGNFYAFTCVDVMAKYKKLKGFDVFEPIGWDAFGIHSENYALKIGEAPGKMLERTVANFTKQIQAAGLSCDWTREVNTTSPEYYKWTQWIFAELFKKGLAYQKEAYLSWCPSCKTVLADEQIEGGVCERCKTVPEKRKMKQWFFKITHYTDRLLDGLTEMDWSDITKSAQKNWIGKSEGANVKFKVTDSEEEFEIFTTRPDTLFGCTYCVLAPEHELVSRIVSPEQRESVAKYIQEAASKSELERKENKEKTGVFSGAYAINPVNQEKVPIWIADYVLAGYGFGAIMAVPAHDERDFEFAKKFNLETRAVISGGDINAEAYIGDGKLINSEKFDGLDISEAKKAITEFVGGELVSNYKLRDWCISRQRYWGPPVPIVYCEKCGAVAVPEKDLPVMLPEMEKDWEPSGDGKGPLSKVESFMHTTCPECGGEATREADVMDNFLDSAWYFFRYLSPKNTATIFDPDLGKKWLPVDLYVGGNEHAVLHLMYTRFITMALHDLGLIDFDNPFKKFRANGMILKDGKKMSKSKGNVINPEEYGEKVGYDALKSYILFLGPLSEDRSFSDEGIMGTARWVDRIANFATNVSSENVDDEKVLRKLHKTIKAVDEDMENQKYNTAIARLMELTNVLYESKKISLATWENFLRLVAIFLPALCEELWLNSGHNESIFLAGWPVIDEKYLKDEEIELVVQVNGKVRDLLKVSADISEEDATKMALEREKIKNFTAGKEIKKVVFVKGKLISLVI
ncbi:MAG: leucine--tRNA ligase [Candidatus Moraniibacteriota bacterium]